MTTAAARRLTTAHRLGQHRLGVQAVAAMKTIWPLLDTAQLDATFERWFTAAAMVVDTQRSASIRLASAYVSAFKKAELAKPAAIIAAGGATPDALATSLLVTGPISIRSALGRGVPLERAASVANASSAASAMRHALNGGRETILSTLANDRDARGWARVTSGGCDFCSMLAGRGAVYSADTVDFHAHDGCSCSAEPVYR